MNPAVKERPNLYLFFFLKENFQLCIRKSDFLMENKNNILKGKPKTLYSKITKRLFLALVFNKIA